MFINVKAMFKYRQNFVFLTSQDNEKTVMFGDAAHLTSLMESAGSDDLWYQHDG